MPLTPIVGDVRLRAFQTGIETTFNTTVAATRRYPWATVPAIDPHWTYPTADTGTIDQAIAPYATALDATIAVTGQLASNDVPTIISAGVMGGLSLATSGTAKTITTTVASTTQDVFDTYTCEWFDDSTDAWQFGGAVINDFSLEYPQDLGPINLTANWRAAKLGTYPATPTGALSVDNNPTYLYCADTEFYVNSTSGAIETTKLSNVAYGATFSVNNNLDLKRFANGSNTRFQIANYGRGLREVTFSLIGAKTSAWVSEAALWIAAAPTERFFGIKTTSTVNASTGPNIAHSLDIRFPGHWLTRSEQTINSNTAFQLDAHNLYDTGLGYPFRMVSVSTRAAL
jgi:hypothetical protein